MQKLQKKEKDLNSRINHQNPLFEVFREWVFYFMKYLIVGLGNPGPEYHETRHNVGFMVLDELASKKDLQFEPNRYGDLCELKRKGRSLFLLKPMTFMNLSGKAIRYWLNELKINTESLLVITDDLALPLGKIRLRKKGSAGGHNGMQNIEDLLGTQVFPRLRFGIGSDFKKGNQVDFVLEQFREEEKPEVEQSVQQCVNAVLDFPFSPIDRLMNTYNS